MSLLNPLALLLGLLAGPIILLYMLKLRRREVEVSSTMLWKMVLRDRQANAPWQRLRRNLLLLLQLLILAGLVAALARPALPVPTVTSGSIIVLLDASASMLATDLQPTRFENATRIVAGIIDALEPDSQLTLILVGPQPDILASGEDDKAALRAALARAEATQAEVDWQSALALAAGAAGRGTADTTVVIVSDGGLPDEGLPPLPAQIEFVPVGSSADNLGISAMALRPAAGGAELFVRVTNFGNADRSVVLSIFTDQNFFDALRLAVPGGGDQVVVLEGLPNRPAVYEARLATAVGSGPLDDFPLDDAAFAVFQPPANRNTLLVSRGNLFLEQILAILPEIASFRLIVGPEEEVRLPVERFGVYVLDGILPDVLPAGNLLLINPPANPLFEVGGVTDQVTNPIVLDHPLTRFVSWENVHVAETRLVRTPFWADVLVDSDAGPLVFVGETEGRRVAVLAFDLHKSDLPLQVSFPILFANLFQFLTPSGAVDAPDGAAPFQPVSIQPEAAVEQVRVTTPSGAVFRLPVGETGVQFRETGETGLYTVNYVLEGQERSEYFAVNLFSAAESSIQPQTEIRIGQASLQQTVQEDLGRREVWPWLAGAALVILLVEWWVYHARQGREVWRNWLRKIRLVSS